MCLQSLAFSMKKPPIGVAVGGLLQRSRELLRRYGLLPPLLGWAGALPTRAGSVPCGASPAGLASSGLVRFWFTGSRAGSSRGGGPATALPPMQEGGALAGKGAAAPVRAGYGA